MSPTPSRPVNLMAALQLAQLRGQPAAAALALQLNDAGGVQGAHDDPRLRLLVPGDTPEEQALNETVLLTLGLRAQRLNGEDTLPLIRRLRRHLLGTPMQAVCAAAGMRTVRFALTGLQPEEPGDHPALIVAHAALEIICGASGTSEPARLTAGHLPEALRSMIRAVRSWNRQHPDDEARSPDGAPIPDEDQLSLSALTLTSFGNAHLIFEPDTTYYDKRGAAWPGHPIPDMNSALGRPEQLRLHLARREAARGMPRLDFTDARRFPLRLPEDQEPVTLPEHEVQVLARLWTHLRWRAEVSRRRAPSTGHWDWLHNVPALIAGEPKIVYPHQGTSLNLVILLLALTREAGLGSPDERAAWRKGLMTWVNPLITSPADPITVTQGALNAAEYLLSHLHRLPEPNPSLEIALGQVLRGGHALLRLALEHEQERRERKVQQLETSLPDR